jgi:serine/threonine protein kinase
VTPERWAQIEELFHRAAECAPENRTALLTAACGSDPELRREVEALLSCDGDAGGAVQAAVIGGLETVGFPLTGETISHYHILDGLGGGGMGLVYRAEDIKLGRRVALKFLPEESVKDPAALGRFEREARSASALEHPNICPIYEFGEHEGQPFLVMQLLEGQTLRELIAAAGPAKPPLELGKLLDLAVQILDGLDAAHQKGIIHRDIKPANIFVTREGQAKILDFGLAKLASMLSAESDDSESVARGAAHTGSAARETLPLSTPELFLSRTGMAMGTAGYMSPEQVRGEKLDARTDLFSFGLVLYEMATGKRAFAGDTGPELQEAILTQIPSPARKVNPEVPAKLAAIVHRALEKKREARYQSASEMRADLDALQRAIEPRSRSRWRATAAGVAVLSSAVATVWFANRRPQSPAALPQLKLEQLTKNSSENGIKSGYISPDGKLLAYIDRVGMHLKVIETGETRTIPQPAELKSNLEDLSEVGQWFPDGTKFLAAVHPLGLDVPLMTSQGSSIWIVPISGAPPQKLRDEAALYSLSPDGSLISFGANKGRLGDREIWVMRADGQQARKVFEIGENGTIGGLNWSPDGQRVIYYKATDGGNETIVAGDLKGGPVTTILPPGGLKKVPDFMWLPDGRMIYKVEEGETNFTCNLWQIRLDPRRSEFVGKPQRITDFAGVCANPESVTADSKHFVTFEWRPHSSVFLADLQSGGTRITTPTRFTLEETWNNPLAWTADSKAVLFYTNRTGADALFKQSLGQDTAEPIITLKKSESLGHVCVTPEGSWILYELSWEEERPQVQSGKIMRVPITGGASQLVLAANTEGGPRCARSPATVCTIAERTADHKQLVFTAFDPLKGRGREIARSDSDPAADYEWDLSPDGTRIAILKNRDGQVHILSLNGKAPQVITAKGWKILTSAAWAADGKGLFVSSYTPRGADLLYMDLQGNARFLWEQGGGFGTYGVPSPDGRHLAIRAWYNETNLWMMENF